MNLLYRDTKATSPGIFGPTWLAAISAKLSNPDWDKWSVTALHPPDFCRDLHDYSSIVPRP